MRTPTKRGMTALDLAIDKGATEVVRWFTDYNVRGLLCRAVPQVGVRWCPHVPPHAPWWATHYPCSRWHSSSTRRRAAQAASQPTSRRRRHMPVTAAAALSRARAGPRAPRRTWARCAAARVLEVALALALAPAASLPTAWGRTCMACGTGRSTRAAPAGHTTATGAVRRTPAATATPAASASNPARRPRRALWHAHRACQSPPPPRMAMSRWRSR